MTSTIIERLGFAPTDRVAVVHIDDIGMCHAANVGAFEALENGPATCGSMMVPCPWFLEAAGRARANLRFDLGVHLTLNAEWTEYRWGPVAGRSRVPSLCDKGGYLPRSVIEVLKSARPEEVEIELRAQIDRALAAGVDVTHLDSHMGTVFFPQFFDLLTRLAADYRLPLFAPSARTDILARHGLEKAAPLFAELEAKLGAVAVPAFDGFDADSLDFQPGEGAAHSAKRLARVVPGLNWLLCHAAKGGDELTAVTPLSAHARDFERTFYGGELGRRAFREAGIRTVGMRPLRELMRSKLSA
jgi:chitin disaccharide deacetylase